MSEIDTVTITKIVNIYFLSYLLGFRKISYMLLTLVTILNYL